MAAPVFDDSLATDASAAVTVYSYSYTVGTGANRYLLLAIGDRTMPTFATAPAYNGVTMTEVAGSPIEETGETIIMRVFELKAPTSGANNITWTFDTNSQAPSAVQSFEDVNQTTPLGTPATADGPATDDSPQVVVASASDELIVDFVLCKDRRGNPSLPGGSGQTERLADFFTGTGGAAGGAVEGDGSTEPGAASVNMDWDLANQADGWVQWGAGLKPVSVVAVRGSRPVIVGRAVMRASLF